jgi:TRAP-type uncharacterized transport system fused permease subunit
MLSFITPPVALGAFAAASIANARPIATGFAAMKLGGAIYLLPCLFVVHPALVLEGTTASVVIAIGAAVTGLFLLVGGMQGFLPLLEQRLGTVARIGCGLCGMGVAAAPALLASA